MKKLLLAIFVFLACQSAFGQLISHRSIVEDGYNFWVNLPDSLSKSDSVKYPAIVFLHGRSLCGNNLNTVLRYGTIDALKYTGLKIPAIVIAPQNPGGPWSPFRLMNVVEWCEQHYPIDTNRIYVFGMSLGGYGTIDFAGTYHDKIAAAIALCGGGDLKEYAGLCNVPLWIIHGYADKAVPWEKSKAVVDAMVAAGDTTRLRYDFMKGVDHGDLARCFYLQSQYDWLLSHSLADSARTVNRNYSITKSDLENAYSQYSGLPKRTLTVKSYDKSSGTLVASTEAATYSGESGTKYITIKKGDTLSRIAQREHTTISKLCSLNGISRNSIIREGKKLRVR